ncbi:hypothetical protein DB347_00630 [Opitutaceae bacterium EW11]|nr:hypothetical protein DB347_00630 [Opitutaceae bacterium EW11]
MRTKVTLVLLFLNVALFSFLYWLRSSIHPLQEQGGILGTEVVNLQKIEIAAAARPNPIRLEKRGETWMIVQPLMWPANEFAVTRILNELQQLRSEASFAVKDLSKNGQSLADYGLDKPPVTLTLTPATSGNTQPASTVLRIGDTAKVGNRLYVLSPDGERVHVVNRSLVESLLVKLEDLRSDTIFSVAVYEVRSLNVVTGAPATSKVRIARGDGRWLFETPITTRANKSETDVTISQLNALRIQSFVDNPGAEPVRLGPDEMTLKITLEGNNRHETLIVGGRVRDQAAPKPAQTQPSGTALTPPAGPSELYYAKMDDKDPVFEVAMPASLLERLTNAQEKLRDRKILDFDPGAVTAITLSAAGQPDLTLQRLEPTAATPQSFNWQIVRRAADQGPQTVAADREIVDRLLQRLAELSAEVFVSDAPIDTMLEDKGFNRPALRVKISLAPAGATPSATGGSLTLLLGIGVDRHTYAKLDSPNYIYQVSDQVLQQMPVESLAYRDRTIRELPPGARITALKLVDLVEQKTLLDTALPLPPPDGSAPAQNGTPAAATPAEAAPAGAEAAAAAVSPAVRAAIETLVAQIRTLRAKKFVRDEFTKTVVVAGEDRPWRYQLTASLSLVGGNGSQTAASTLFFSERAGGNTEYAGSPEFDVVFETEQPLLDALFTLVYGPRDPGPPPPEQEPAPAPAK